MPKIVAHVFFYDWSNTLTLATGLFIFQSCIFDPWRLQYALMDNHVEPRSDDIRYRFKRTEFLPRRQAPARPHAMKNSLGEFTAMGKVPALPVSHSPVAQIIPTQIQPMTAPQVVPVDTRPVSEPEQLPATTAAPLVGQMRTAPSLPQSPASPLPRPMGNEFVSEKAGQVQFATNPPAARIERPNPIPQSTQTLQAQAEITTNATHNAYATPSQASQRTQEAFLEPNSVSGAFEEQGSFEDLKMDQDAPAPEKHFTAQIQKPIKTQKNPKVAKVSKRRLLIAGPIVIIMIGASIFGYTRFSGSQSDQPQTLSATIVLETEYLNVNRELLFDYQAQLAYPIYYPKTAPKGYRIDESSFNVTQGLFSFQLLTPNGKTVPVVQQQLKPGFAVPGTDKDVSVNIGPTNFKTDAGVANIIATQEKVIGLLTTEQTVVIVNMSGIPGVDCEPIMRGIVPLTSSNKL